jgi:hypothetical protein
VAKVTVNGEVFEFDMSQKPMSEALAVEKALGMPYARYDEGLREGFARSMAGFIWLVWRRNGRDVKFADIESGAVDIDLDTLDIDDGEEVEAGPTTPTPPASSTTAAGTSARSPKSSTSARGNSAS